MDNKEELETCQRCGQEDLLIPTTLYPDGLCDSCLND